MLRRDQDAIALGHRERQRSIAFQRQQLERAITGYKQLERDLDDNLTLMELGEAEGDASTVGEAEAGLSGWGGRGALAGGGHGRPENAPLR